MTAFDDALEEGRETMISAAVVKFVPRGVATDDGEGPSSDLVKVPQTITMQATQKTTPTAQLVLTFENPDWDMRDLTPNREVMRRVELTLTQQIVGSPTIKQTATWTCWITGAESETAGDITTVTITAVSADWILTQHEIVNDIRREVIANNVDNFWITRFQMQSTGIRFREFVDLKTGLTQSTPGAPAESAWIPLSPNSSMWDVAQIVAGYFGRAVAGYCSSACPPPVSFDQTQPTVMMPLFADPKKLAKDLRTSSKRVFGSATRFNDSWAEKLVHHRKWSEGSGAGNGAVEFEEVTEYGTVTTDLRPQLDWTTWSKEENPILLEAALQRVRARQWITTITTRLDLDLWLGDPVITDDGIKWIAELSIDVAAGHMTLTLDDADQDARVGSWTTIPFNPSTRRWPNIAAAQWIEIGL